ncbi:hypothetical protein [Streptomyces sp. CL12-4]|uniref:hypothetical protein n=1 Tax=Streptomyces sp. CL12-4 TaxID=2810306 RepID=UPI001EFBC3A2|nr:hypothetical protein [Streptomyces sp. CL12-4]MCG8971795.1 hypothetical protein [Streptomyces sp. CL12-4]
MPHEPVMPTGIYPTRPRPAAAVPPPTVGVVELGDERDPVVYLQDAHDPNKSVAVRRSALQPTAPTPARDLAPQPLIDPLAARMLGGGVGGGVLGWGAGEFLAGASKLVSAATGVGSAAAAIALLLLAWKMSPSGGGKTVNITNNNRWGGRSSTRA